VAFLGIGNPKGARVDSQDEMFKFFVFFFISSSFSQLMYVPF